MHLHLSPTTLERGRWRSVIWWKGVGASKGWERTGRKETATKENTCSSHIAARSDGVMPRTVCTTDSCNIGFSTVVSEVQVLSVIM